MQFKKSKTFLAAVLAAAMTCSAVLPTAASAAAGTRTKDEAYGDKSYAQRFMSLYDDVVTNGVQNGYMSSTNTVSDGLGIPYHSVEDLCIEAPTMVTKQLLKHCPTWYGPQQCVITS